MNRSLFIRNVTFRRNKVTQLRRNQEIETEITGVSHDGAGVGRCGSEAVFIPGAAPGDRVRAVIIAAKKSYAVGKLTDVITASPDRIECDCGVYSRCGGCCFRHISYEAELKIKYARVKDALERIAHISAEPEQIIPSEKINGYRNKAEYPVGPGTDGKLAAGFYAPRSHRIIPNTRCLLEPGEFAGLTDAILAWAQKYALAPYNEADGTGLIRHIYLRRAEETGEIMVCLVINSDILPHAPELAETLAARSDKLKSVVYSVNKAQTNVILGKRIIKVAGSDRITDIFGGKLTEISPLSFYQVNKPQAEKLYETAAEYLGHDAGDMLLDLYCGMGTIGRYMSSMAGHVTGVETVPEAVEDARRNAEINGITNMDFICADAGAAAAELGARGIRPDTVTVDPPRRGLGADAASAVIAMAPPRVVYISCDPATLARDLCLFSAGGYRCERVRPVDLFPRTAHVETAVLLKKI